MKGRDPIVRQPLREVVASSEGRRPSPLHHPGGHGVPVQEPSTELTPLGVMRFLWPFSGRSRRSSYRIEMFALTKLNHFRLATARVQAEFGSTSNTLARHFALHQ
jgi:hypothetical protein